MGAHQKNTLQALKAVGKEEMQKCSKSDRRIVGMCVQPPEGTSLNETALIEMYKFWCVHLKDQSEGFIGIQ